MVMNVGKISTVHFKGAEPFRKPIYSDNAEIKITELGKTTPDFGVQTPQKYTNLGITELENGVKIHSYKLANGHRVSIIPMEDSPTTVKNYVNVGSLNETDDIKGISHFLEHMAFNGTNGTEGYIKLNRGDSFKKIDELGGWTNASTNYALTDYVNSTPLLEDEDLEKQIQIIAAMTEDLKLSSEMIEKEKFPVCSEIDMILDSPETVAIDQTIRSLFNIKSSADELVGGSVEHIQNLDRQKVLDYYNKYYTPDNMHLVITGDVDPDEVMRIVSKNFRSKKIAQGKRYDEKLVPISKNVRKDFITDKTSSATAVIGLASHKTNNVKDEVISDIVTRYIQSSDFDLTEQLNDMSVYSSFGFEKISTNMNNPALFYYVLDSSEENVEKALKLVFDKFSKLKMTDEKILNNIKESLSMDYIDSLESSMMLNNTVGNSTFDGNLEYLVNYNSILKNITLDDVNNYIKKYVDISKAAVTVVHPETTEENIHRNYENAKSISFQAHSKRPVNPEKVSETVLENNYKLGFQETKNNNSMFGINFFYDLPDNTNPAAYMVLNEIFSKGTMNSTKKEFKKELEDNNIYVSADLDEYGFSINGYSSLDKFDKTFEKAYELFKNPRIKDEDFNEAITRLKATISRYDKSTLDLYEGFESSNNPYYTSKEELLDGLDKLTIDDVRNLYNYIINNSSAIIVANVPETHPEMKDKYTQAFSKLDKIKPYTYKTDKIYKENLKTVVLTEPRNVSQAEISQIFKFEVKNDIKDKLVIQLMNSILSSSNSIGLFNSLRETDHLAYRVNSSLNKTGNCGEERLFILTSTDNKDTGKTSYDNLQKAIYGFNRQINKLLNSEYKDSDLETAKRALKAEILINESANSKMNSLLGTMILDEDLSYNNKRYELIDSITREDIDNMAKKVFSGKPIYSIVASQDTLDYNKDFLNSL